MEASGRGRFLRECSGGDALMGAAPAWLSLLIMLLIGFILGSAAGVLWSTRRQRKHSPAGNVEQQPQPQPWSAQQYARKTATLPVEKANQGYAHRGPLGSSLNSSSARPTYTIQASSVTRTLPGPSSSQDVFVPDTTPQGDLSSVAHTLSKASSLPRTGNLHSASDNPFTSAGNGQGAIASGTNTPKSAAAGSFAPEVALNPEGEGSKPASTPTQQHELDARKQARKAQDAARVAPEYELDELTDEWQSTLQTIDEHLFQAGRPTLDGRERAVVMRCLIESTARESTDTAVHRALGTIERLRRLHANLPAGGGRP